MSDTLQTHELWHARLPCPSPTPGVYPDSCSLRWWCYLTISFAVAPFSSCLQSFPISGSFQMSQLFASGGQNQNWSFSFNICPSNEHTGPISFKMDWLDLFAVQGTLKSLNCNRSIIANGNITVVLTKCLTLNNVAVTVFPLVTLF